MSNNIQIIREYSSAALHKVFLEDILSGMSKSPKRISCSHLYDTKGSYIFQQIMELPEYYVSDSEIKIFKNSKEEILKLINKQAFQVIELGAGDGRKTKILLDYFYRAGSDFEYIPIDISKSTIEGLVQDFKKDLPKLAVKGMVCEYGEALSILAKNNIMKIVLFIGSSLGNFNNQEAQDFCCNLNSFLSPGDLFLLGVDMVKDTNIILDAYNDSQGITESFNMNLLDRINHELDGNFDKKLFQYHVHYDPIQKAIQCYLVSKQKQKIRIGELAKDFYFDAWEAMHTESSHKFTKEDINNLAQASNFDIITSFQDEKGYFSDTVWQAK